jgi:hypothetical protein
VSYDQLRGLNALSLPAACDGVVGRRGQSQKHGLLSQRILDGNGSRLGHDQPGGSATKQTADTLKALSPWNEDSLSRLQLRVIAGADDATDSFVARDQRVTHARECRHASVPQQSLCARTDPAVFNLHLNLTRAGSCQPERLQRQLLGLLKNNGLGFHGCIVLLTLLCVNKR